MEFKDYYKILGVEPDVDAKTLKSTYRKLARKYHPDVSSEADAEQRFKEVSEAYEVLKDKNKRAEYDKLRQYGGEQGFQPPPGWQPADFESGGGTYQGGFSDFFDEIFGQAQHGSRQGFSQQHFAMRGEDIEFTLAIFLEDALEGRSRAISFKVPVFDDQGRLHHQEKTLNVKIPAGVIEGERIRLKGQGAPGIGDAPAGDLYLHVKFAEHPLFVVDGANLSLTLPISPWEAALGCKPAVPTLDGSIHLTVPPNSQSGARLRVKGRGLGKAGKRGDLYVVLQIVMPRSSSEQERALWQKLADVSDFNPREKRGYTG
jgi:curved DNA-binding protein